MPKINGDFPPCSSWLAFLAQNTEIKAKSTPPLSFPLYYPLAGGVDISFDVHFKQPRHQVRGKIYVENYVGRLQGIP